MVYHSRHCTIIKYSNCNMFAIYGCGAWICLSQLFNSALVLAGKNPWLVSSQWDYLHYVFNFSYTRFRSFHHHTSDLRWFAHDFRDFSGTVKNSKFCIYFNGNYAPPNFTYAPSYNSHFRRPCRIPFRLKCVGDIFQLDPTFCRHSPNPALCCSPPLSSLSK